MGAFTAALAFRQGLQTAIESAVDTDTVLVTRGKPGQDAVNFDDWIVLEMVGAEQEPATISTNRTREETLTQTVVVECFRAGGEEAQEVAEEAAYALLGAIEEQVRVTDTTLGGVVRWCFLTGHRSDGFTSPDDMVQGRSTVIEATFTARARITS